MKTAIPEEAPGLVQERDVLAAEIGILEGKTDTGQKRKYRGK